MHMRSEFPPMCGRDHLSFRSYYFPVKVGFPVAFLRPAFRLKFWVDDSLDFPPRLFPRMWSTAICASSSTAWTPTSRKAWPKSWTERRPRSPRNWRTSAPATPSKHLLFSDQDSWDETYCAYLLMHTCNIFVWLFFFFTSSAMMQTTFFLSIFFFTLSHHRLCCINQTNSRSKTHNGYYVDLSIKSSTIDAVLVNTYMGTIILTLIQWTLTMWNKPVVMLLCVSWSADPWHCDSWPKDL